MEGGDPTARRPPRRRARRIALAILLVLLAALALAWFERRALVRGYADDLLRERGVPARYTIADLGPGGQRLTDVTIGDPRRPDLTADWIETDTRLTLAGPQVVAVRAGTVRVRGRIVDGRLSLGALDRLLPAPSGAPFAFPAIDLTVADARARIDTPAGPVGLKLSGQGALRGGFVGQLAMVAPQLASGGCVVRGASAYGRVTLGRGGAPGFAGPVRIAAGRCGGAWVDGAMFASDVRLSPALDRWRGAVEARIARVGVAAAQARGLGGTVGFAGDATATAGRAALTAGASLAADWRSGGWGIDGAWRVATRGGAVRSAFAGTASVTDAIAPRAVRDPLARAASLGAGTPLGPIAARLAPAAAAGLAAISGRVQLVAAADTGGEWRARVGAGQARFGSGAAAGRIALSDGAVALGPNGYSLAGNWTVGGGALPQGRVVVEQAEPGAPISSSARFAPYRAGDAVLTLAPVRFSATPAGRTLIATQARVTGPLGDGRVEDLSLPLTIGLANGRWIVNPGCAPLSWQRLRIAGLALDPGRLGLCPTGSALVAWNGRLAGGARLAASRVTGRLGGSSLELTAAGSALGFADGALAVDGLAARLGAGETPSRLTIARLTGRIADGGIAGRYAGAGGRIGTVPLILADAAGDWRLEQGVLTLGGALTVSDAAVQRRFEPLPARGVALRLADGVIDATGRLTAPGSEATLADVAIRHVLGTGSGHADLTVPGITFTPALQPTALTPLTLGVVADVRGTVAGRGRIDWDAAGVRSGGRFATERLDLAAAFGPVAGLSGTLTFTDLLALQSAADQVARVASINPGVAVEDGTIRYQLLPGPRIRIAGGDWPFAGGRLTLDPALLDFSTEVERRMTFRVAGMDAALFLQRFDYKNLAAAGVFDGTLPMVFDAGGGRIENGRLAARSGGTLSYVGEVSQENLGTWGNLAFQALKSLRYRDLSIALNGPLAGEMVTDARFGGVAQGAGAKSNFLTRRITRLPFVFNVRLAAPFRALIDTARSFWDPNLLVQRNLPSLIEAEKAKVTPIQPRASAPVPQQR